MVYVISKENKPLMPCSNVIARLLLKQGKAKVKKREPFTIKLTKEIEYIKSILPITTMVFETGQFDTHLMKNPNLIKGRMSTGYAILMDIDGNKADFSAMPKGYKTPKMVKLKRIEARTTWMITTVEVTPNIA